MDSEGSGGQVFPREGLFKPKMDDPAIKIVFHRRYAGDGKTVLEWDVVGNAKDVSDVDVIRDQVTALVAELIKFEQKFNNL